MYVRFKPLFFFCERPRLFLMEWLTKLLAPCSTALRPNSRIRLFTTDAGLLNMLWKGSFVLNCSWLVCKWAFASCCLMFYEEGYCFEHLSVFAWLGWLIGKLCGCLWPCSIMGGPFLDGTKNVCTVFDRQFLRVDLLIWHNDIAMY